MSECGKLDSVYSWMPENCSHTVVVEDLEFVEIYGPTAHFLVPYRKIGFALASYPLALVFMDCCRRDHKQLIWQPLFAATKDDTILAIFFPTSSKATPLSVNEYCASSCKLVGIILIFQPMVCGR